MDGVANPKCQACKAEIIFVKTVAGKSMPCNPPLIPYWEKKGGPVKLVTIGGRVVSCETSGDRDSVSGYGRESHFATCPAARNFRKRK